jgi:teichuronic acid biosynthesis glycosyltransferase TuaC
MRILTVTTLYPNAAQPTHAVFVENRLRRIVATGDVSARVIAPVPWFPFKAKRFGAYAQFAATPRHELRHGLSISHPRFMVLPKCMTIQPHSYLRALRAEVETMRSIGYDFDVIDAQYVYPDGVAAAQLGAELGKPVVVTARGSDLHQIAELPGPRKQIQAAFKNIDQMITVSSALGDAAEALGYPRERIEVLRNGVDTAVFHPVNGCTWRARAGGKRTLIASVGLLIPRKGNDLLIRAMVDLPDAHLLIIGQGPDREKVLALASNLGVTDRVELVGSVPHEELAAVYSAADMLVLATSREGWPNVLLEAMACGAPVVATNIGGIPEIITKPALGVIVPERTPEALADGIRNLIANPRDRALVQAYAEAHGWDEVIAKQAALYHSVAENYTSQAPASRMAA